MAVAYVDFRGIVALDYPLIDQLTHFLRQREETLANEVREVLQPVLTPLDLRGESLAAVLAALSFAKHVPNSNIALRKLQIDLDLALWRFVEVLEGGVTELFEQLDQVELEAWTEDLAEITGSLVALLRNHIEGTALAIDRLEELLVTCRDYAEVGRERSRWLQRLLHLGGHLLDRQLSINLKKTRLYLDGRYLNWKNRYNAFAKYNDRALEVVKATDSGPIFLLLPASSQTMLSFLQRMVKVWESDAASSALLLEDLMRAVRGKIRPESAYEAFRSYYALLKDKFFATSREIKVPTERLDLAQVVVDLVGLRKELAALRRSVARFREFLLRTDPNPYVRSRWGFPEWVVGPEPAYCRQLLHLEYQTEALDRLYGSLGQALTGQAVEHNKAVADGQMDDIQKILHGMSQPLLSRHVMASELQRLLKRLERFDELASTNPRAVDFVGQVLLRALRYDSKFTLLFDDPLFHRLYFGHHELVAPLLRDQTHNEQIAKMRYHISRVLRWVQKGHGEKHLGDIETLQKDLSSYLGELRTSLASKLQTAEGAEQQRRVIRQQMLDFRFQLGDYYHRLGQMGIQGRQVRGCFVGVDHLLEAIEVLIEPTFDKPLESQK